MGRGKRQSSLIALSDGDGRSRRLPATKAPRTPSLAVRLAVQDLGERIVAIGPFEPVLRLSEDGERLLVYGSSGQTLVGNLGDGPDEGALLAQLMREGHSLKASIAKYQGGLDSDLVLELNVEVY
jgi:hypothetical protein